MIQKLPAEVLSQIIGILDQGSVLNLTPVSKKLQIYAKTKLYGKIWFCTSTTDINRLERLKEKILTLSSYTFAYIDSIETFFNILLTENNAALIKEIHISILQTSKNSLKINHHLRRLINLENLVVRDCYGQVIDTEHCYILNSIKPNDNNWNPHFKTLNINFLNLINLPLSGANSLESIEKLTLEVEKIETISMEQTVLFEKLSNLKYLAVSGQFVQFFLLLANSSKIKYCLDSLILNASPYSSFGSLVGESINAFAKVIDLNQLSCLNLELKHLASSSEFERFFFMNLEIPSLIEFSYESSENVTEEFYAFLKKLQNLKRLNIDGSAAKDNNSHRQKVYHYLNDLPSDIEIFVYSNFFRCDLPDAMLPNAPATINFDEMVRQQYGEELLQSINCALKERNQDEFELGYNDLFRLLVSGDSNTFYYEFNDMFNDDKTFFWRFMARPRINEKNCIARIHFDVEDSANILSIVVGVLKHMLEFVVTKYTKLKIFTLGGIQFKIIRDLNNERYVKFTNFPSDLHVYEQDPQNTFLPPLEWYEPSFPGQEDESMERVGFFGMLRHFHDNIQGFSSSSIPGIVGVFPEFGNNSAYDIHDVGHSFNDYGYFDNGEIDEH